MGRTKTLGILAAGLVALTAFGAASCASTGSAGDGLSLQEAIEQAAAGIPEKLPPKTRVAIVNFDAESPELSEYVMEELTGALYDSGVADIADRRNLDFVRKELNLQISGEVSDESAMSIGQFLGAQSIITGELVNTGDGYRFRLSVVNVETAAREVSTRLNVSNDKALQNLAAALGRGGKPTEAIAAASAALKAMEQAQAAPQSAGAFLDRGLSWKNSYEKKWNPADRAADRDQAITCFNAAINLDPTLASAYFWRGYVYNFFDERDYDMAIADFTEAIRLKSDYVAAYQYRGNAYAKKGDYDRAIADYTEAIRIKPDYAFAYYNRGIAYQNKGDSDKAIQDFEKAVSLEPDNQNYVKALWDLRGGEPHAR